MKLSIVTITYRDPEGLRRTIESLQPLLGTSVSWEHVIVDSSPEVNEAVLCELPSKWPLVRRIEPPAGIYTAMNAGIAAAGGEWVWLLNGGDRLNNSSFLDECLRVAEKDPPMDLICAGAAMYRDGQYVGDRLPRSDFFRSLLGRNCLPHQAILYRRHSLQEIGEFSTKYRIASDYEHHFRCYFSGFNSRILFQPLAACDLGGVSDNFRLSIQECREITFSLRHRFPWPSYWIQRVLLEVELARLLLVKTLRYRKWPKRHLK